MEILLIRHGETEKNSKGKMHTIDDAVGLTEKGKRQAQKVAEVCKKRGVDRLYSSPEVRAIETAEIISQELGLPNNVLQGLRERNWGEWEGKSFSEIKPTLDAMTVDERYAFRPPGGETWEEMDKRLLDVYHYVARQGNKVSAIVSHGGAIRASIPLLNGQPKETSFHYDPPNASITVFSTNGEEFKQEVLLDTSHLDQEGR